MKKILSMLLVCAMLVSMFAISAAAYKKPFEKADEARNLLDFESDAIDTKYGDAKVVANPDATGANANVMQLAAPTRTGMANNSTGNITVPEFHLGIEDYMEFKVKLVEGDLPLYFKINDGTREGAGNIIRYFELNLEAEDFSDGNWHTVSLYVKDGGTTTGTWTATITNDATGETKATTISKSSGGNYSDGGAYYIYYNIAAPANSAATTWLIDDIGFYDQKQDVYSGNSFTDLIKCFRTDSALNEMNFEDVALDTKYNDAKVVANPDATAANTKALLLDAISRTSKVTTHTGNITVPEFHFKDETFFQFRVMLETGDVDMVLRINDGTSSPVMKTYFDVTLDTDDFEEGKWYTVALHIKDGSYSGGCTGTMYVYDESKGVITSEEISATSKNDAEYAYFIKYSVPAPANNTQTKWYIDDIGFYNLNLSAAITPNESGIAVNLHARDNSLPETAKAMLVYYDENDRMIDVAMANVVDNVAELSMSTADTEAMATAEVLVWGANNVPVMSTWDITKIIPAE